MEITYCYIAGYGRSGSTLLDIILSNQKDIISLGAVDNIWKWIDKDYPCACGERLIECHFWKKILIETEKRLSFKYTTQEKYKLCKNFESISGIKYLIFKKSHKEKFLKYIELQKTLLTVIKELSNCKIIVDSSKTTLDAILRPYLIKKYIIKDTLIIHLKRKLGGVTWSSIQKAGSPERMRFIKSKFILFFKSFFACIITDLFTNIIYGYHNYHFNLKYESFVSTNGIKEIQKIFQKYFNYRFEKNTFNEVENFKVFHNIGGNRLRFKKDVKIIQDNSWAKKHNLFCKIFCYLGDLIRYD